MSKCSNLYGHASRKACACDVFPVPGVPVMTMFGSVRCDEDVDADAALTMLAAVANS